MKLYRHEFNPDKNSIKTVEFEVEETPKTYVVSKDCRRINYENGVYEWRILKSDICKLSGRYTRTMITLTPDKNYFINELINTTNITIKNLTENLESAVARKTLLMKLAEESKKNE